ncbi:MAG: hypothetical protein WC710_09250 [Gallionella sp.]|jgi:hypothetical protein
MGREIGKLIIIALRMVMPFRFALMVSETGVPMFIVPKAIVLFLSGRMGNGIGRLRQCKQDESDCRWTVE